MSAKCPRITAHIAKTTVEAGGGSKKFFRSVCRPVSENNGSFSKDKPGKMILLGSVVISAIVWALLK